MIRLSWSRLFWVLGGLAVALAECCIGDAYRGPGLGASIDLAQLNQLDHAGALFGEDHARAVVSCAPDRCDAVLALAARHGVPAAVIGSVTDQNGALEIAHGRAIFRLSVEELRERSLGAIPRRMDAVS